MPRVLAAWSRVSLVAITAAMWARSRASRLRASPTRGALAAPLLYGRLGDAAGTYVAQDTAAAGTYTSV